MVVIGRAALGALLLFQMTPTLAEGLDLDAALGGATHAQISLQPVNSLDRMLSGVNELINYNRRERARAEELARLEQERLRLEAEIRAEQQRVASKLRKEALARKRAQQQADNGFGKALFGAALGFTVGKVAGLDSVGSIDMATEYMQAVVNDNPAAMQAAAGRITNNYISRRNTELHAAQQREQMIKSGKFDIAALTASAPPPSYGATSAPHSGGGSSSTGAVAKPPQMPSVCSGYTRSNYSSGNIVGDPQIDTHCQAAMHYYDLYAANVGDPNAKPDQLEKAYQAHLTSARVLERFSADTQAQTRPQLGR